MKPNFCRIASTNALNKAIDAPENYPSGNYIDWNFVESYMFLELYATKSIKDHVTPTQAYYTWYDRAVGLYIDQYGEPNFGDIK